MTIVGILLLGLAGFLLGGAYALRHTSRALAGVVAVAAVLAAAGGIVWSL